MKMSKQSQYIVADTSALISLFASKDSNHQKAIALSSVIASVDKVIIIPADVFSETVNVLGKKEGHRKAVAMGREILNLFQTIETADQIRSTSLDRLEKQPFSVSFTDCIVMEFADFYNTKYIFGFDKVFSKNGYIIDMQT
jgi:predicted nucleic acid-binding protein